MRLVIGILCLCFSIWMHSLLKWELKNWVTSPLPRPEPALFLSGEFALLGSDYFLIKAAVFYSSIVTSSPNGTLWFSKALYLASYLDPYYFEPYWMTGVALPWEGRVEEAKVVLKRGLKYLPQKWQIPFYIGFINFYFEHDNKEAAHYFSIASKLPGAPSYLPLLVARLSIKGGETRIAIAFLQEQIKTVRDEKLKRQLEKRLKAFQAIDFLERAVRKYKQIYGYLPSDLNLLVTKNIISAIPPDPYGGQFYLTPEGKVWSTSNLR